MGLRLSVTWGARGLCPLAAFLVVAADQASTSSFCFASEGSCLARDRARTLPRNPSRSESRARAQAGHTLLTKRLPRCSCREWRAGNE